MSTTITLDVAHCDDETFSQLVIASVRRRLPAEQAEALLAPEVIDRYHDALLERLRQVDLQLTGAHLDAARTATELRGEAWARWVADKRLWRLNTIRYKNALEAKLREAKARKVQLVSPEAIDAAGLRKLFAAIEAHKHAVLGSDDDVADDEVDERLWRLLEDPDVRPLLQLLKDAG